jgi:hypothetical protein
MLWAVVNVGSSKIMMRCFMFSCLDAARRYMRKGREIRSWEHGRIFYQGVLLRPSMRDELQRGLVQAMPSRVMHNKKTVTTAPRYHEETVKMIYPLNSIELFHLNSAVSFLFLPETQTINVL